MEDPSQGVPPALLNHVHLVCAKEYAYHPAPLRIEDARNYLLQASQIVRDVKPVAWQYLNPPKNGTILLVWQPVSRMGRVFASDGYVWAGTEKLYSQDIGGCTVELAVCETGVVPNQEHEANHRRMRYRLIQAPNNTHYDPNLEIVHYTEAFPEHRVHARAIRPHPQIQKQLHERAQIEKHGTLQDKKFMLHDKYNWPTMTNPGQQTNPYQNSITWTRAGAQHFPASYGPRPGAPGPSPAKRPRQGQPGHMSVGGADGFPHPFGAQPGGVRPITDDEAVLLDEDNPRTGDQLELISPAEISVTRYKQHHEWMEEILSSPYAASQIVPVDLGLRLTGELGELTDVLWQGNGPDAKAADGQPDGPAYKRPTDEKLQEFQARVAQFIQKGEEQLAEMKRLHAEKKEELTRQELFANLEKKLAEAGLDGNLDAILLEAERSTGSRVVARNEIQQVQKGGLLTGDEEEVAPSPSPAAGVAGTESEPTLEPEPELELEPVLDLEQEIEVEVEEPQPAANDANDEFNDFTNMDTAGEALDFFESMDTPT